MSSEIQHRYADLEQVTLHYLIAGEGEPVVLLHGVPQTSHEWRRIMPQLRQHYLVIAPDLRGLGDSSRPKDGYDKKTVGNDIWQLVHDHLKIDKFFLVGHDWGGPVAFSLAAQHRDSVRRLAVLDIVIPGDGTDFSQGGHRWHHAVFRTPDLPEALFAGREELALDWLFENLGYRSNCISEEDRLEYYRTYKKLGTFRAMLEYYRTLPQDAADNNEFIARDGKLQMPILALGGGRGFGRGKEAQESLRRVGSNVQGGIIPNCGHWVCEEAPDFIAGQLINFFSED